VILVIDEVHTLIGAGAAEGAIDAANILKPALAERSCSIGALRMNTASTLSGMPPSSAGSNQSWWVNPRWRDSEILYGLRDR